MADRRHHRAASSRAGHRPVLTKSTAAAAARHREQACAPGSNNVQTDERERRLALQDAAIALAHRATSILNAQRDPETLDLAPFAAELDDVMMNELANQLAASLKRASRTSPSYQQQPMCRLYSTVVLSGCDRFTPVGVRSFIHAVGASIRRLDVSKTALSIAILQVMATGIETLETLDFSWCLELTSESVHAFISCCNAGLTRLSLSNCPALNDDALGWISGTLGPQGSLTQCKRLLSLDLSYSRSLSDRGLAALGHGCCALQFVNLEGLERISSAGIQQFVSGCKRLRVLSLRKCMQLTDAALVHIGEHCHQLRSLNLCGCYRMSSTGLLAMVRGTPVLQALNLEGCLKMREDILAAVATSCLSLQVLNVNGCQEITDSGLATLAEHLPFVQLAEHYRGLEPKTDGLQLKFSIQQRTIHDSAALRIQAIYRGHVARRIAASWRVEMIEGPAAKTIRKSYVRWRLNTEINRRVARTALVNTSVVKIQALMRGVLCRTALERASGEAERIRAWSKLAVKVQAVYRSHWTRRHYHVVFKTIERYRREQALVTRHAAVVRLQRAYRARFHRSRLDDIIAINQQRRLERVNAATLLQRLYRSRAARKAYRTLRYVLEQQHAKVRELVRFAIKIQSRWRGHRAREQLVQFARAKQERELRRYNAASRINAGVRGYFGRRIAHDARVVFQTRQSAAKRIQRAYRQFKTPSAKRIEFERMLARMQSHMRDESDAARSKQSELLRKTRALIDRDSASESESDDDWRDFADEYGDQFWFSPSRKLRQYVRPNESAFERALLGLPCRVYWPLEQQWFSGRIARFNRVKSKHRIEYDDGDHEWLCLRLERARVQLYNGYCWCMVSMFEPSLRTLRATTFVTLRCRCYDASYRCWRSGVVKAYSEPADQFCVAFDDDGGSGDATDTWVDVFRSENTFQVQDAITSEWYSLSGYVFGRARGRPLNFLTMANGRPGVAEHYYSVEDYLSYVEAPAEEEREQEEQATDATDVTGVERTEGDDDAGDRDAGGDDATGTTRHEDGQVDSDDEEDGDDADDEDEDEDEDDEDDDAEDGDANAGDDDGEGEDGADEAD